jgi:hypothetical protein
MVVLMLVMRWCMSVGWEEKVRGAEINERERGVSYIFGFNVKG